MFRRMVRPSYAFLHFRFKDLSLQSSSIPRRAQTLDLTRALQAECSAGKGRMPSKAQEPGQEETEREALDALAREFSPSLKRYFSKRIKETHDIEDLVQEVFARLAKRRRVSEIDKLGGYVFQTASSVLTDWLRYRRSRNADRHVQIIGDDDVDAAGFSPERVLIGKKRLADVTAIIMEMPERTRTIFVLRRMEGLRYRDIAARLKLPLRTVERHMAAAAQHLESRIRDDVDVTEDE